MKYLRNFNDLNEAKTAGVEGLDSPHIDIIEGYEEMVNVYQSDEPTFTCGFAADGKMYFPITALTIENLTWAVDIPAAGGTADKDNCLYQVKGYRSNNTVDDLTAVASVSGSVVVTASTITERHSATTLTLYASFEEEGQSFSATASATVYQAAFIPPVTWSTYSAASEQNITFPMGSFYMSYDHTNWSAATFPAVFGIEGKEKIYIAGENNQVSAYGSSVAFGTNAPVAVGGVVNGLTDCFNADTSVLNKSFNSLYSGATAISVVENTYLPATGLTRYCYAYMFDGCTSLTTVPALPALSVPMFCYMYMFNNCTSLNEVHCQATDISADACTAMWINNASSTGTFYANAVADWPTGVDGIPSGWTRINE